MIYIVKELQNLQPQVTQALAVGAQTRKAKLLYLEAGEEQ